MSELLQHEIDHLDGMLMTTRAVDAGAVRPITEHAALVTSARPAHRLSLANIADAARTIVRCSPARRSITANRCRRT